MARRGLRRIVKDWFPRLVDHLLVPIAPHFLAPVLEPEDAGRHVWRHVLDVRDTGHHPVLVAEDLLALERVPDRALVQAPFLLVGVRRYTLFLRFSSRFA